MYLIAGLGNPGERYRRTRHNVGFMLADRLARRWEAAFERTLAQAEMARAGAGDEEVLLVKPQTYMNHSGDAVAPLVEGLKIEPRRLLVVYDDIDLPLGRIRLRRSGSSGGQKGMRSILQALGTQEVPRLRIGILEGEHPGDVPEYVLSEFTEKEKEVLEKVLQRAEEACLEWIASGIERAMSLYNG
ncbi:MAG TPA: aminoacyl-tRNA hydrolase [Acidobacteriota bacterium]|nr:aminoacyl-tRNA hydrolase [Acidobacteriota bacterium]